MNKNLFAAILVILIIFAVVLGVLVLQKAVSSGADTPENAVWFYEKAAMLYDAQLMVKYSSPYNLDVLNDANPSKKSVSEYLGDLYETTSSIYSEDELSCTFAVPLLYNKGTTEYAELLSKYQKRIPDANIDRFSYVELTIRNNGKTVIAKYSAYAVEIDGKWFFFKPF